MKGTPVKNWFIVFCYALPFTLMAKSASGRPQSSDYMACSISDNGSYVSILVIPQAYTGTFGREEAIVRRSCDSKMVQKSFGWMTAHDCSKQVQQLKQILLQLQASKACPSVGIDENQNSAEEED